MSAPSHRLLKHAAPLMAALLFVALGLRMSDRMMSFSEEYIAVATPAWHVLAAEPRNGVPVEEPSCADVSGTTLLASAARPTLALCRDGRALPVMGAPYFTGLFGWPLEALRPLHRDDPFVMRKLVLPLGVLAIVLAYLLLLRFSGPSLAALGAFGVATSPAFVLIFSMLTTFESLPFVLLSAVLLLLAGDPAWRDPNEEERAFQPRRIALAGFVLGLSFLANVKVLFFALPLAAVVLRARPRLPKLTRGAWMAAAACVVLALVPMALPKLIAPDLAHTSDRGANALSGLASFMSDPARLFRAARDLVLEWSNVGFYFGSEGFNPASAAIALLSGLYVTIAAVRFFLRGRGDLVAATCGTLVVAYLGAVALLYDNFPANFLPLHVVYGLSVACLAHALMRLVSSRIPHAAAMTIASLLFVPMGWNALQTADAMNGLSFATNASAERALVSHLTQTAEKGELLVTTNLLAGGVIEQLSGGRLTALQAHAFLDGCTRGAASDKARSCLVKRWSMLLDANAGRSLRVVFSPKRALVRRTGEALDLQLVALQEAANDRHRTVVLDRAFTTPSGAPASELYRVALPEASVAEQPR